MREGGGGGRREARSSEARQEEWDRTRWCKRWAAIQVSQGERKERGWRWSIDELIIFYHQLSFLLGIAPSRRWRDPKVCRRLWYPLTIRITFHFSLAKIGTMINPRDRRFGERIKAMFPKVMSRTFGCGGQLWSRERQTPCLTRPAKIPTEGCQVSWNMWSG